jgi:hypothetical protein
MCFFDSVLGVHGTLYWSGCFVPDKTPADTSQHNVKAEPKPNLLNMSTMTDNEAYKQSVFIFFAYITGCKPREDLQEINESLLRIGETTLIEQFVKDWGFDDEEDALAFGKYIKEQYLLKNKKAFKGMPYPFRQILLDVLDTFDDDKTVILEDDGDDEVDEVHASVIEGKK